MTLVNTVSKLSESSILFDLFEGTEDRFGNFREREDEPIGTTLASNSMGALKKGDIAVICLFYQFPTNWRILRNSTTLATGTSGSLPQGNNDNRTGAKIFTDVIPSNGTYTYNLETNLNGGQFLSMGITTVVIKKEQSFAKRDGIILNYPINTVSKLAESSVVFDTDEGTEDRNDLFRERASPSIGTNLAANNMGSLNKGDIVVMCLFYQFPTSYRVLRGTTTLFTGTGGSLPIGISANRTGGKIFTDVVAADGSYTYNLETNLNGGQFFTMGMTTIVIKKENSFAKRDGIIKN